MKLSKTKKVILLTSGIGILIASIVTPIVIINSDEKELSQDEKELKKVIELLESKNDNERIIVFSINTKGKIIANNQEKIIAKIKELIGDLDLKEFKIEVSMEQDQEISTTNQKIIIKISKGKYSKIVSSSKPYFVKKFSSQKEEEKYGTNIIEKIKSKIKNKDLIIPKNVRTFSDEEILLAIKNQLKINNLSLTNSDLSKIIDNIWHLKPGKKTSVILKIESLGLTGSIKVSVTKEKNIKLWTKNSAIVTNSNIEDGMYSSFIQDTSGNLWTMGGENFVTGRYGHNPTKLQVLKRDGEQWEEDTTSGLTKGSNIINGTHGKIFEDDFGNIWSMGKGTKLQVLVKNKDGTFANSWTDKNEKNGEKLLQGSKINDGFQGTIFQDSFGNLWAMGNGSKLQVLAKNKDGSYASSWISNIYKKNSWSVKNNTSSGLLKNCNIFNGKQGIIFQDFFGNLWAMGFTNYNRRSRSYELPYSMLQVLEVDSNSPTGYVETGWKYNYNNERLLKNSEIISSERGTIFQDKFKNLWISGNAQDFKVLKANQNGDGYVDTGWTNDNTKGLLKNSNVVVPGSTWVNWVKTIFQDSFGNLWVQGYQKKPQVLEVNQNGDGYVTKGWTNDNNQEGLLNNLKLSHLSFWVFFQDSSKNLWAMGNNTKLQVLKAKPDGTGYVNSWSDDNGENGEELLKGSNIKNGQQGLIFEDSSKNFWTIGRHSKLQVYDKTLKRWKS